MSSYRKESNRNLIEWYEALIYALAFLVLLFTFGVRVAAVDGQSMVPTLNNGDRLLIQSFASQPQRGDVVVIDGFIDYGKPLVKRVIALGGDTVDIDFAAGIVSVNGTALDEPYTAEPTHLSGSVSFPVTVPEGHVFVMGDNRQHSTDSRSTAIGFIDERDILGRVLWRIFPIGSAGAIE